MSTSLSEFYRVRSNDSVKLKITIGHAQEGVTTVKLGTKELEHNRVGSFERSIGVGKDLDGKTLFCATTVADVRTETNETSVTYEVTGGVTDFKETLQKTVAHEKEVVFYTATIRFYI